MVALVFAISVSVLWKYYFKYTFFTNPNFRGFSEMGYSGVDPKI